ncbi:hypothetical protein BVX97_01760 [bacterium E08(2017)]|nr:hypothetical protein BVX97_01760 [bacterium E08(2017)]
MSILQALVLGLLQGLTEFLPVSSSGHLILMQNLFGMSDVEQYVLFDLLLHLGTLLAVLIVFRKNIVDILLNRQVYILYIAVGVLALLPFYFVIDFLKSFYGSPMSLGFFFIVTAMVLLLGEISGKRERPEVRGRRSEDGGQRLEYKTVMFVHCVVISLTQLLAILPGVSRSGITVSTARVLGWDADKAAEYSFLLSVPVILMGVGYEVLALVTGKTGNGNVSILACAAGFLLSFVTGIFALKLFISLLKGGKFKYFIIYCLAIGSFCLVYFNLLG